MASGPQAAHYGAPVPQGGVGMMPPQQQPFKGTLAPGTRVQVGSITVTVKKYLSEGEHDLQCYDKAGSEG